MKRDVSKLQREPSHLNIFKSYMILMHFKEKHSPNAHTPSIFILVWQFNPGADSSAPRVFNKIN